jgi:hypothetical protein
MNLVDKSVFFAPESAVGGPRIRPGGSVVVESDERTAIDDRALTRNIGRSGRHQEADARRHGAKSSQSNDSIWSDSALEFAERPARATGEKRIRTAGRALAFPRLQQDRHPRSPLAATVDGGCGPTRWCQPVLVARSVSHGATLEAAAGGVQLGRFRPGRPARPAQPDHAGKNQAGGRRGPRGADLLSRPAARISRRQQAEPGAHAADPRTHADATGHTALSVSA